LCLLFSPYPQYRVFLRPASRARRKKRGRAFPGIFFSRHAEIESSKKKKKKKEAMHEQTSAPQPQTSEKPVAARAAAAAAAGSKTVVPAAADTAPWVSTTITADHRAMLMGVRTAVEAKLNEGQRYGAFEPGTKVEVQTAKDSSKYAFQVQVVDKDDAARLVAVRLTKPSTGAATLASPEEGASYADPASVGVIVELVRTYDTKVRELDAKAKEAKSKQLNPAQKSAVDAADKAALALANGISKKQAADRALATAPTAQRQAAVRTAEADLKKAADADATAKKAIDAIATQPAVAAELARRGAEADLAGANKGLQNALAKIRPPSVFYPKPTDAPSVLNAFFARITEEATLSAVVARLKADSTDSTKAPLLDATTTLVTTLVTPALVSARSARDKMNAWKLAKDSAIKGEWEWFCRLMQDPRAAQFLDAAAVRTFNAEIEAWVNNDQTVTGKASRQSLKDAAARSIAPLLPSLLTELKSDALKAEQALEAALSNLPKDVVPDATKETQLEQLRVKMMEAYYAVEQTAASSRMSQGVVAAAQADRLRVTANFPKRTQKPAAPGSAGAVGGAGGVTDLNLLKSDASKAEQALKGMLLMQQSKRADETKKAAIDAMNKYSEAEKVDEFLKEDMTKRYNEALDAAKLWHQTAQAAQDQGAITMASEALAEAKNARLHMDGLIAEREGKEGKPAAGDTGPNRPPSGVVKAEQPPQRQAAQSGKAAGTEDLILAALEEAKKALVGATQALGGATQAFERAITAARPAATGQKASATGAGAN
jgi:hypothetical protein